MKIRAHESFYIRKGWLHKGIKNIQANNRLFNGDVKPCDVLGIGNNMVKSLRYWLQATQVMEEKTEGKQKLQCVSPVGLLIDQYDKYYEEQGTIYLLQYLLASNIDQATAWYWFFNVYNGTIIDKEIFVRDLAEYLHSAFDYVTTDKVLEDEYSCLIRTYSSKEEKEEDPEETKVCPLTELHLLELVDSKSREYKKVSPVRDDIHPMIMYAVICDNLEEKQDEVLINNLCQKPNNIGRIFNLDRIGIIRALEQLARLGYISISRTAGLDLIKIVKKKTMLECAELYYKMLNGEVQYE